MSAQAPVTLLGAGLAGSLLAVYLARRGHEVVVYERLPDMRRHEIPAGRSINLALAHRGIRALDTVGLMSEVQKLLIPMRGRMLHDKEGATSLTPYGRTPTEVIYSVSRPGLNMKTRALICVISDTCMGREPELELHLRMALRQGWTEDELVEVLLHLSGYIGVPIIRESMQVASKVFKAHRAETGKA